MKFLLIAQTWKPGCREDTFTHSFEADSMELANKIAEDTIKTAGTLLISPRLLIKKEDGTVQIPGEEFLFS